MKHTHYRQGDLLLTRVEKKPTGLKKISHKNGKVILAEGEVTGHHHALAEQGCALFGESGTLDGKVTYLEVGEAMAALTHEEHGTIDLKKGTYCVTRQREYSPEAIRNVQD